MKKNALILGLFVGVLCAQQLWVSPLNRQFVLAQLSSVQVQGDSLIYHLKDGGRVAALAVGTKWAFRLANSSSGTLVSSSVSSSSSAAVQSNPSSSSGGDVAVGIMPDFRYRIESGRLSVQSSEAAQFQLLDLTGRLLESSAAAQTQWHVQLWAGQNWVLRIQTKNDLKNYLIQSRSY